MPRQARKKSCTDIYHVMLRGVNRQTIFYDAEDRKEFLKRLLKYKKELGFDLYAYCLMDNHIHLLLRSYEFGLDTLFRSLGASYVHWYNKKYDRVGNLFQDRYKSETVEDELYLMTVLRYILRNPVSAGMCSCPGEYEYSSIREYVECDEWITDIGFILGFVKIDDLIEYINTDNNDKCIDDNVVKRLPDAEIAKIIYKKYKLDDLNSEKSVRDAAVADMLGQGVTIHQLSRVTGIPRSTIRSIKNRLRP
ncbi:MAG: transposase [Lachnospiraceae bacterium]|nr:transposase [Lachnospiraceae bacterium]